MLSEQYMQYTWIVNKDMKVLLLHSLLVSGSGNRQKFGTKKVLEKKSP